MTTTADRAPGLRTAPTSAHAGVLVDVVVPVFNEEANLDRSVRRLRAYLDHAFPFPARITIADNASTDATWSQAAALAAELPGVRAVHLDEKGRGRALREVWSASDAPVLAYMDVDLSTDLAALLPLVAPLLSGHSDVAIGSRLARHARVARGPKRELISRAYNLVLHAVLTTRFSDAQCGFKAIRADRAHLLLPHVKDNGWFFDTELLVLAERAGLRIHEVPVDWTDDPDSRVDIVSTAIADLSGVARLVRSLATGRLPLAELRQAMRTSTSPTNFAAQFMRFATIGVLSTVAYLLLYVALRGPAGPQAANAIALLLTAVANTAANRRHTFGVTGSAHALLHHAQGLAVFGLALGLTAGTLAALHASAHPSRGVELAALVVANLAATVLRFVLLRGWVFRRYAAGGAR